MGKLMFRKRKNVSKCVISPIWRWHQHYWLVCDKMRMRQKKTKREAGESRAVFVFLAKVTSFCWIKRFTLMEGGSSPPLSSSLILSTPLLSSIPPPLFHSSPLSPASPPLPLPLLLFFTSHSTSPPPLLPPSLPPSLPPYFLGRCGCSSHGNHQVRVCLIRSRSINNSAGCRW